MTLGQMGCNDSDSMFWGRFFQSRLCASVILRFFQSSWFTLHEIGEHSEQENTKYSSSIDVLPGMLMISCRLITLCSCDGGSFIRGEKKEWLNAEFLI
jgi:hypothetical protein